MTFHTPKARSMSLRRGSPSERALATSFLAALALGYALALTLLCTNELLPAFREGKGPVVAIARTFHGDQDLTRLEVVLKGRMAFTLRPGDMDAVQRWIRTGGTREGYRSLDMLVQLKCANCHRPGMNPPLVRGYEDLRELLERDTGPPMAAMARRSHVHLYAIPLMLFPLGLLFVRTRFPERLKAFLVVIPFAALAWDLAHWWLTRAWPFAAWGVLLGGTVLCVGFLAQWALCVWDLHGPAPPEAPLDQTTR